MTFDQMIAGLFTILFIGWACYKIGVADGVKKGYQLARLSGLVSTHFEQYGGEDTAVSG